MPEGFDRIDVCRGLDVVWSLFLQKCALNDHRVQNLELRKPLYNSAFSILRKKAKKPSGSSPPVSGTIGERPAADTVSGLPEAGFYIININ